MATSNSTLTTQEKVVHNFKLKLGRMLFSDPQSDRENCVVVSNCSDITADIKPGDLLRVDFTANEISEGLYIITLDDNWIGYRFFHRCPTLHMRDSTDSYPVTSELLISIKVVGRVKNIYREKSHD